MTRARARAIENEVDSLLFEFRSVSHESWILPSSETLCMLRYQEDNGEKERTETQVTSRQGMEEKEEENEKDEEGGEGANRLDAPGARPLTPPGCPGPWPPTAAPPGARA